MAENGDSNNSMHLFFPVFSLNTKFVSASLSISLFQAISHIHWYTKLININKLYISAICSSTLPHKIDFTGVTNSLELNILAE